MDISNYTETCQLHGSYRFTRPCNREFGWALVIMLHDLCALLKCYLTCVDRPSTELRGCVYVHLAAVN